MTDLNRTFGDTRRISGTIKAKGVSVDISGYTNIFLVVGTTEDKDDASNVEKMRVAGSFDLGIGKVHFVPNTDIEVGNYFYNIFYTDDNGELFTVKKGRYIVDGGLR